MDISSATLQHRHARVTHARQLNRSATMPKRFKLKRNQSNKIFRQGAERIHPKNLADHFVMRGGIRL